MIRGLAVVALVLALLALGFASFSYMRLREAALSTDPTALIQQADVQFVTSGLTVAGPGGFGSFCRGWQDRLLIVFGGGLLTLLICGTVLLTQKKKVE